MDLVACWQQNSNEVQEFEYILVNENKQHEVLAFQKV